MYLSDRWSGRPCVLGRRQIYNVDRTVFRFAYGLKAINLSHYTNKPSLYDPAAVIAAVDLSLASNADDALLLYEFASALNDARNFLGPTRGNFVNYRQSEFVVDLMDGTAFGVQDPRSTRMLAPSRTAVRGLNPKSWFRRVAPPPRPQHPTAIPLRAAEPRSVSFDEREKNRMRIRSCSAQAEPRTEQETGRWPWRRTARDLIDTLDFVNRASSRRQEPPRSPGEKAAFLASQPSSGAEALVDPSCPRSYHRSVGWGNKRCGME